MEAAQPRTAVSLRGRHILVVEDEYMLADDLRQALEDAGATVIGPFADVANAIRVLAEGAGADAAVLDVNLGGAYSFPVADELTLRHIPFVFVTGYDTHALPPRYQAIVRCEKPVALRAILGALSHLLGG